MKHLLSKSCISICICRSIPENQTLVLKIFNDTHLNWEKHICDDQMKSNHFASTSSVLISIWGLRKNFNFSIYHLINSHIGFVSENVSILLNRNFSYEIWKSYKGKSQKNYFANNNCRHHIRYFWCNLWYTLYQNEV